MKNKLLILLSLFLFSFVVMGCIQQDVPDEEVDDSNVSTTDGEIIGEGDQAINSSDIPEYDESADEELEDLINDLNK